MVLKRPFGRDLTEKWTEGVSMHTSLGGLREKGVGAAQ